MYSHPTLFPQSTNREDLTRTVSIFDDDTGQPVNLSGVMLLQNPNGFTGSNWAVTDGAITTTSTTSFMVPGYPVSNQLTALSITVGTGLGILAGDPVTIADVAGNASIIGNVLSYAANTGALVVQVGLAFQLEIRSEDHYQRQRDYSTFYDWGTGSAGAPIILAALGSGLSIIDIGYLQINIPALTMQRLVNKSYLIALVMSDSINTRQVLLGKLPVLYGGITQMSSATIAAVATAPVVPPVVPPIPPVPPSDQSDNIPAGVP